MIEAAREAVRNWAAWAMDDDPHVFFPNRVSFARQYVPNQNDWPEVFNPVTGAVVYESVDEPQPVQIDVLAAQALDDIIQAMSERQRLVIAWWFLRHGYLHAVAIQTFARTSIADLEREREAALRRVADWMCERVAT